MAKVTISRGRLVREERKFTVRDQEMGLGLIFSWFDSIVIHAIMNLMLETREVREEDTKLRKAAVAGEGT